MSGSTFGKHFTVTIAGESHGPAYICIVDGCPPGMLLCEQDIQVALDKRRPGQSTLTSQRREEDNVRILSGVFEGKTTGTPIGLIIENTQARSRDYEAIKEQFRPGHADYTYHMKYGFRDYRGGGRASARETMMRVAAGAIAQKYLRETYGIQMAGYLAAVGDLEDLSMLDAYIAQLRREGNSVGARVNVVATGVPVGLGEPIFDRLDADIAKAMMSIPAVKGVEVGDGFACVNQRGSEHRDEMDKTGFLSNHAGGVLGGISTGQDILVSVAFKPTSSITIPGKTMDIHGNETTIVTKGRHDPCVGIRAAPVVEAMLALVLMDKVANKS